MTNIFITEEEHDRYRLDAAKNMGIDKDDVVMAYPPFAFVKKGKCKVCK
jgi:hypothetical protein